MGDLDATGEQLRRELRPQPAPWQEVAWFLEIERDGILEQVGDTQPGDPRYRERMLAACGHPDFKTYWRKVWGLSQRRVNEYLLAAERLRGVQHARLPKGRCGCRERLWWRAFAEASEVQTRLPARRTRKPAELAYAAGT